MGAHNFEQPYSAKNMKEAYNGAVADAHYDFGHDPYNGTISTTNGFKDLTSEFRSSGKPLETFIEEKLDVLEKWGEAGGVCVKEPEKDKLGDYIFFGWAAD
jgi:hypothetical protein